jgi:hypothetical protein
MIYGVWENFIGLKMFIHEYVYLTTIKNFQYFLCKSISERHTVVLYYTYITILFKYIVYMLIFIYDKNILSTLN